jgi:hypothetical protein
MTGILKTGPPQKTNNNIKYINRVTCPPIAPKKSEQVFSPR